jgi:tetratricopeptide (TPR) repeat protein
VSEIGNHISVQRWQRWLQNPSSLELQDMDTLQNLHLQYPWMSKTYKLLAYLSKKENLSTFSHWNQYAALTSSNNHELFDLIHGIESTPASTLLENIPWVDNPASEISKAPDMVETVVDSTPSHSLADLVMEEEKTPVAPLPLEEDWAPIPLITLEVLIPEEKEVVHVETAVHISAEIETAESPVDLGELGNDIMSKAISSSIELEVSEAHQGEFQTDTSSTLETQNTIPSEQLDWEDDYLNFIAGAIGERTQDSPALQKTDEPEKDVISQFIQKEPQITRGRLLDFEVGNMAKESLEEDYNLVTETMAKLYIKQGKIEKARKAYKKLIELFPEKSIYFATQLKNLNKKNQ